METEENEVVDNPVQDLSKHFTVADEGTLFLRQLSAEGQLDDGEKFELSQNLKGGELLVRYKGRCAYINMKSYIIAAANAVERALEDEKGNDPEGN